jgi:GR25 family glycosyltransferase involved in LPS biosynthesis
MTALLHCGDDEAVKIEDDVTLRPDFEERLRACRGLQRGPYIVLGFAGVHRKWIRDIDWTSPVPVLHKRPWDLWGQQCVYLSPGTARLSADALKRYLDDRLPIHCDTFLHKYFYPRVPVATYLADMVDHVWDHASVASSCTARLGENNLPKEGDAA